MRTLTATTMSKGRSTAPMIIPTAMKVSRGMRTLTAMTMIMGWSTTTSTPMIIPTVIPILTAGITITSTVMRKRQL